MMPRAYPLLLLSAFALLSCHGPAESSSAPPEPEPSSSETEKPVSLTDVFPALQSKNIVMKSQLDSVQVSNANPDEVFVSTFSQRIASFDEGKYQLDVYENDVLTAQLSYFKDEAGDAASAQLNLQNEVEYTKLSAGGQTFPWNQSVYYNLFADLSPENFIEKEGGAYVLDLSRPGFSSWGDYLVQSWTGVTTFDTLSLTLKLEKGALKEIVAEEVPTNEEGAEYSYARRVTTTIQSIGEAKIDIATPYPSDPENKELRQAIDELKGARNFTTTLKAYPFTQSGFASEADYVKVTKWTQTDIASEKTNKDQTLSFSGYHGYENGYGQYEGFENGLGGKDLFESNFTEGTPASLFPDFAFSEDIFRFVETKPSGEKVYQLRDTRLAEVLAHVAYGESLGTYLGQAPIRVSVKDGHLQEISYDGAGLENFYLYALSFSAIGATEIDPLYYASYEKASPVLSYQDERLCFLFEDDLAGPFDGLTMGFGEFFEIGLGPDVQVPFYPSFAPARDEYYGGITETPEGNLCEIACLLDDTSGFGEFIGTLYESGFAETVDETGNYLMMFEKGELKIGLNEPPEEGAPGGGLGFLVPATNFLA